MSNNICFTDVNGKVVLVHYGELMRVFTEGGFTLFGMDLSTMLALHEEYCAHGGELPPTAEKVRRTFARD